MHVATMSDKGIINLINKLNQNKTQGLIHLRPLSPTVDFAKVWLKQVAPTKDGLFQEEPFDFYFIRNENGVYVAGVLVMENNLHWLVLAKHRGNGYLTQAMRETILYHLFENCRQLRITIDKYFITPKNFNASQKVALSLGFEESAEGEYLLSRDKYKTNEIIDGKNTGISEERLEELRKQIKYMGISLRYIQSELEMKIGNSEYVESLKELANEVFGEVERLDTELFEYQRRMAVYRN